VPAPHPIPRATLLPGRLEAQPTTPKAQRLAELPAGKTDAVADELNGLKVEYQGGSLNPVFVVKDANGKVLYYFKNLDEMDTVFSEVLAPALWTCSAARP